MLYVFRFKSYALEKLQFDFSPGSNLSMLAGKTLSYQSYAERTRKSWTELEQGY